MAMTFVSFVFCEHIYGHWKARLSLHSSILWYIRPELISGAIFKFVFLLSTDWLLICVIMETLDIPAGLNNEQRQQFPALF